MFWIGLFTGIFVYVIFTIIMIIVTKYKIKKEKSKKQEYDSLVDSEIIKNKRG